MSLPCYRSVGALIKFMTTRNKLGQFVKGHPFLKGVEKGWFKKGQKPWNTGTGKRKICLTCGKVFILNKGKGQGRKFCSLRCRNLGMMGKNHHHWKGGKVKRGKYWSIKTRSHPSHRSGFYVKEHRLIMEKYLGRYLTEKEVVHHINGDPLDNRIKNLQLFSSGKEHQKFHQSYSL